MHTPSAPQGSSSSAASRPLPSAAVTASAVKLAGKGGAFKAIHLSIPKAEIGSLPPVEWQGRTVVVDTEEQASEAVSRLMNESGGVVGFDTETRPAFKRGSTFKVALMQVSTNDCCYLFRLNKIGIPSCLRAFLADERVMKIGLSIRDDFNMLQRRDPELEFGGFVDLQVMVHDWGIDDASLQRIYAIVFGRRITKGQRLTNWEAPELTPGQQSYASIDAWSCLQLWQHLNAGGFNPAGSPWRVTPESDESKK